MGVRMLLQTGHSFFSTRNALCRVWRVFGVSELIQLVMKRRLRERFFSLSSQ